MQADTEYEAQIVKRSPSIVFLPPLPDEAIRTLQDHNKKTLDVYTAYMNSFVEQYPLSSDNRLPLTTMLCGSENHDTALSTSLPPTKIRSAFVALSGHDDTFASISDLCQTVRSGVFLEEAVVPYISIDPQESKAPLNAWLYDFYMHGDVTALEKGNVSLSSSLALLACIPFPGDIFCEHRSVNMSLEYLCPSATSLHIYCCSRSHCV